MELGSKAITNSVTNTLAPSPVPSADQLESQELEELYTGGKTAITRAKKNVLARLHSYLTGATFEDSSRLNEIIFAMVGFSNRFSSYSNFNFDI